jgi:DNA-binding beta-propeller fold protein YncE
MGGNSLAIVDLHTMKVVGQIEVGETPRAVVIDPVDPAILYVTLNLPGDVVEVNRHTHKVLAEVHTGQDCRSLAISTDGTALWVVNYLTNSVTMLRASDLKILQVVDTGTNPVGIAYDGSTGRVWVAVYTGEILVFDTKKT